MDFGVSERAIFKTTVTDLAKTIQDKRDVTVIAMAKDIGSIIPFIKLEDSNVTSLLSATELNDIVMFTKINVGEKVFLHLEDIIVDNELVDIEYDHSTVYVDYNVRFVLSDKIYEDIISNGAIGINIG